MVTKYIPDDDPWVPPADILAPPWAAIQSRHPALPAVAFEIPAFRIDSGAAMCLPGSEGWEYFWDQVDWRTWDELTVVRKPQRLCTAASAEATGSPESDSLVGG